MSRSAVVLAMRVLVLSLLLGLVSAAPMAQAQGAYGDLESAGRVVPLYHEAFALPADGGAALVVSFRLPNPLLIFEHDSLEGTFTARAEVTVQVWHGGQLVEERLWRRLHRAPTFEATQDAAQDLEGTAAFTLPPGAYVYRLILGDFHAERTRRTELYPVTLPDFSLLRPGRTFLARHVSAEEGIRASLVNLGGDAALGEPVWGLVPFGLPQGVPPERVRLHYRVYRLGREAAYEAARRRARRRSVLRRPAPTAPARPREEEQVSLRGGRIVAEGILEEAQFLRIPPFGLGDAAAGAVAWPAGEAARGGFLAPIDLQGEGLDDGVYILDVLLTAAGEVVHAQTLFETHWRGRPAVLRDPGEAIQALRFIEDRSTVRTLLKGSQADREARLRQYWERRDPTPETAFNELMAEYYRRVDYAASAFRAGVGGTSDGLRTDQARVYIVYGPPASVDRQLTDLGGVEETWTYPDGRRFIFWAATSLEPFRLQKEE